MTSAQLNHVIGETLYEIDFSEWDALHQIGSLCDDYEAGDIEKKDLIDEVKAIIESAGIGDHLENEITNAIHGNILEARDD